MIARQRVRISRGGVPVGDLERTSRGASFTYLPEAKTPVGYRMPVQSQPYEVSRRNLHPLFAGMLGEGPRHQALLKQKGILEDDEFGQFAATCSKSIGDVTIGEHGHERGEGALIDLKQVSELDFQHLADEMRAGKLVDPTSIAGVQAKLTAANLTPSGRISSKSSLIKFGDTSFPKVIQNEHFFMRLASKCRLRVPRTEIVRDARGKAGLLVPRFDRIVRRGQPVISAHVEDACQFMDVYPSDKYKLDVQKIGEGILDLSSAPIPNALEWLRVVLFSYLIGNADLHARNVSLFTDPETGLVGLAPAYDLLSTAAFHQYETSLAIPMNGKVDRLTQDDFVTVGCQLDIPSKAVKSMTIEMFHAVTHGLTQVDEIGWDSITRSRVRTLLNNRLESFGSSLNPL